MITRSFCTLLCIAAMLMTVNLQAAEDPAPTKIKILLMTGGHGFDQEPFFAMFDAMEGIECTRVTMPDALDLLKPGLEDEYDCIVTYDMNTTPPITDVQAENFKALLKRGIGYVALHHNLGAHRDWPEYTQIVGGKNVFKSEEIDGVACEPSSYKHDVTVPVELADNDHPITRGIEPFEIHDEVYGNCYVKKGVHVLLTTDHPLATREVAWTTSYGRSPVFYLMLGHDARAYANPNFPKLIKQGIQWATKNSPLPLRVKKKIDIETAWSGHRVGFSLLSDDQRQYAAYYDADRNLVVASRQLESDQWTFNRLPTKIVWDSHNYVTMALDAEGQLHLSGNMHCVPLIYFRTSTPGDVMSLQQIKSMTGEKESRCTYPRFMTDADEKLIFTYRDGGSGNGNQIWNVYDTLTHQWTRLLDQPLFDGQGLMNAYFHGPVRSPDGWFHLCWVWRDTPDCATNHDVSYAKSPNMRDWYRSDGTQYNLPITLETGDIVDPIPAGGGIINGNAKLGFDAKGRPVVTYHKYDADGITQVYNARHESDGWNLRQVSDWDYRWEFSGGGSINFEVSLAPVSLVQNGQLTQSFSNRVDGGTRTLIDPETLLPIDGAVPPTERLPSEVGRRISNNTELQVRLTRGMDASAQPGSGDRYYMHSESRGSNRDRPFEGAIPAPVMLRVYQIGY